MVWNSCIAVSVAHISAEAWQRIACIGMEDRVSSHQLLDVVCCFPLQQLGRLALYLWTFLCLPPPDSFLSYSYYSDGDDDDDDDDLHVVLYHHHHHHHADHSASSSSSSVDLDNYYYHSHSD